MKLSVLIPTHNPRADLLQRTLDGLRSQTLPLHEWELLLIDNGSQPPVDPERVAWHPHGRIVTEPAIGLTRARAAGCRAAQAGILVWCDDDNVLDPDYLAAALAAFETDPHLGAAGGKSIPEYEEPLPDWYKPDLAPIGCRDQGDTRQEARWDDHQPRRYPDCAPIGAGLVLRRSAMLRWVAAVESDPDRARFGRTGTTLSSGEDNDINLSLLEQGWTLAYLPELRLTHLIPARRLTREYQARIGRATFRDFVRVLSLHGIHPWPSIPRWSVPLRQLKAWFTCRAWAGPARFIRWQSLCGQYEGRAARRD